ncbi:hypothetical protein [Methylobacterium sp. Leaf106]|uniref:hypothetical protein n=1 Tax=Methylobacterium sp. Leaf106 TaxID=1736255 RepID=UPI0006FF16ED|nr:hypothetical protein [Methylobacterium sp. Leaf106]KQP53018.1 hypothetical protein ASF34_01200 [Methylobacterium sp. Leaf106]
MSPAARARAYARSQKWIKANPQKRRAHRAVEKAKKQGALRPEPCAVCRSEPAEAHHPDYADPLRIEWLCPKHHKAAHREAQPGE